MSKTRILEAVRKLDVSAVRALLDAQPALLAARDPRGHGLLSIACAASCGRLGVEPSVAVSMVSLLLERGIDLESVVARARRGAARALRGGLVRRPRDARYPARRRRGREPSRLERQDGAPLWRGEGVLELRNDRALVSGSVAAGRRAGGTSTAAVREHLRGIGGGARARAQQRGLPVSGSVARHFGAGAVGLAGRRAGE